uniref:Evasin n=1 Tax=Rhipicephalus appendiculatus TaxID=34631 RepID=A0A131YW08_RHIAP
MKNCYFLVTTAVIAVSLATGASQWNRNDTTARDRFRVTNSSTQDCGYGFVFCTEYSEETCKSGCACYTRNATEPFLCVSETEAEFYKTGSRYN